MRSYLSTLLRTVLAVARNSCKGTSLPWPWSFVIGPVACDRVALKVTVFVTVALLEQFQKRIAEGWVHSNTLSRVVTSYVMPRKALLEQGLIKRTAAIEVAGRSHPGRMGTAFAARVVPRTQSVTRTVERAEKLDACVGTRFP
jgi:hypothetical protein